MKPGFETFALPALRVHERLMQSLPVRTHLAPEPEGQGRNRLPRSRTDTRTMGNRIRALKKAGLKGYEIAVELQVSPTTVSKHLRGYIKASK